MNGPRLVGRGNRVVLRRPTARDLDELLALHRESHAFHRGWASPARTRAGVRDYLKRCRGDDYDGLLVCAGGAIVGVFNLSQIFRRAFQNASLGYYAHVDHAGLGYMREGLRLVLRHAFRTLGLHRIEANIQPGNVDSKRLARHAGFRREGCSPRYLKIGGRWRDHERWAMTREEWPRG